MNVIDSLEIDGFWGSQKLKIQFNNDLNFIIGHNGSGKTTAINILSAALRADIPYLYSASFDKIIIKLKTKGKNVKPIIEIVKETDESLGSLRIKYILKENSKDKLGRSYGVEGPAEGRIYRDRETGIIRRTQLVEEGGHLSSLLGKLVEINWLSINRAPDEVFKRFQREDTYESPVDQKLKQISRAFANYFSLLSSKAEQEVKVFQENILLSMIQREQSTINIFQQISHNEEEKDNLNGVLRELGISKTKSSKTIDTFYKTIESVRKKHAGTNSISVNDALTLGDAHRVKSMVSKWNNLNEAKSNIFKPRTNFVNILNSLYVNKTLAFDERNIPKIKLPNKDEVDIQTLSSGEKQLFILLGEALLQENRDVVFISDEPELSLHIKWQSNLFEKITSLNPNSQVITATHSPDIVGPYKNKVIKIEDCFYP